MAIKKDSRASAFAYVAAEDAYALARASGETRAQAYAAAVMAVQNMEVSRLHVYADQAEQKVLGREAVGATRKAAIAALATGTPGDAMDAARDAALALDIDDATAAHMAGNALFYARRHLAAQVDAGVEVEQAA